MRVMVTGANGFIGRNLVSYLKTIHNLEVVPVLRDSSEEYIKQELSLVDWVIHLAGVNRPETEEEFEHINYGFTKQILDAFVANNHFPSIIFSSSAQVSQNNKYGISKLKAEELIQTYSEKYNFRAFNYRLTNVFGKWCKPNYNSVVATFCHNTISGIPLKIDQAEKVIDLCYVDEVVNAFYETMNQFAMIEINNYPITISQLAATISSFNTSNNVIKYNELNNPLLKYLLSTFISYLPYEKMKSLPTIHQNDNGSFTEIGKSNSSGQYSINVSKPGVIKGDHWHRTKHEKFIVVSGRAIVRMRDLYSKKIEEFEINESNLSFLEIPAGKVHHIENIGEKDLITIMWSNEIFDPVNTDTFKEKVFYE